MELKKTENLNKDFCVVASNKMYAVLNQNGTFSPVGFHVEGKMSGIFSQPYRISNGYKITQNSKELQAKTYNFENGGAIFNYENFTVKMCAFDNERVLALSFFADENFNAVFEMKTELDGCWTSEECGFKKGNTLLYGKADDYAIFKHEFENLCAMVYTQNSDALQEEKCGISINIKNNTRIFIAVEKSVKELIKHIDDFDLNTQYSAQQTRRETLLNKTKLTTDCAQFDTAFNALKLNYDMLVQNIDNVGEGYTTGFPDFPWFFGCDTSYGSHGTLSVGQVQMTKQTLKLIKDISLKTNGNGRVVHEVSPFGLIYNEGNLQETPHFISAVYETYKWTGDKEFLSEMLPFCLDGMKWAESKAQDGALCPVGAGIIEVPGLEGRVIDIAVLMVNAYKQLAYLCNKIGKEELEKEFESKKTAMQNEILEKFYCKDEEFFADIICTEKQINDNRDLFVHSIKNTKTMCEALEKYIDKVLNKQYKDGELIPVVLKNWVTILPYAEDFLPSAIKEKGVAQMKGKEFYNDYGMKLACKCDDKKDEVNDIYTLNKSMSINTGFLAQVFAVNKDVDTAFDLLLKLSNTLNDGMPGAISEILPDDGCFVQLWSGYGIHHVFMRHILGIEPDAPNKSVILEPKMPKQLNFVQIDNLKIADCIYNIKYTRENGKIKAAVTKSHDDYAVILRG